MMSDLARLAVACALLAPLSAQQWLPLTPANLGRRAMVYDVGRGRAVLHADARAAPGRMFTWEHDGPSWHLIAGPTPSLHNDFAMAYGIGRARTVLFDDLSDTWEYDGTSWTQTASVTPPFPRAGTAMTYDIARGSVVLFGGSDE